MLGRVPEHTGLELLAVEFEFQSPPTTLHGSLDGAGSPAGICEISLITEGLGLDCNGQMLIQSRSVNGSSQWSLVAKIDVQMSMVRGAEGPAAISTKVQLCAKSATI